MTAIKPERLGNSDKEGPEKYAPDRRPPDKLGDVDQAVTAFEGEIREFVRRDGALQRRPRDAELTVDGGAENLNALIRRVSGASVDEIDRVISELQSVRDMLRSEGDRVSREVAGYASLSHAAMTAMKVIGDSLTQWKSAPRPVGPRNNG